MGLSQLLACRSFTCRKTSNNKLRPHLISGNGKESQYKVLIINFEKIEKAKWLKCYH